MSLSFTHEQSTSPWSPFHVPYCFVIIGGVRPSVTNPWYSAKWNSVKLGWNVVCPFERLRWLLGLPLTRRGWTMLLCYEASVLTQFTVHYAVWAWKIFCLSKKMATCYLTSMIELSTNCRIPVAINGGFTAGLKWMMLRPLVLQMRQ